MPMRADLIASCYISGRTDTSHELGQRRRSKHRIRNNSEHDYVRTGVINYAPEPMPQPGALAPFDRDTVSTNLGGSVHHLVLDLRRVWGPGDEHQLVTLAPICGGEVEVKHTIAALVGRKGSAEVVVRLALVTESVNHNLRVVVDLVHEVSVVVGSPVKLEGVERLHSLVSNSHTGSLRTGRAQGKTRDQVRDVGPTGSVSISCCPYAPKSREHSTPRLLSHQSAPPADPLQNF